MSGELIHIVACGIFFFFIRLSNISWSNICTKVWSKLYFVYSFLHGECFTFGFFNWTVLTWVYKYLFRKYCQVQYIKFSAVFFWVFYCFDVCRCVEIEFAIAFVEMTSCLINSDLFVKGHLSIYLSDCFWALTHSTAWFCMCSVHKCMCMR